MARRAAKVTRLATRLERIERLRMEPRAGSRRLETENGSSSARVDLRHVYATKARAAISSAPALPKARRKRYATTTRTIPTGYPSRIAAAVDHKRRWATGNDTVIGAGRRARSSRCGASKYTCCASAGVAARVPSARLSAGAGAYEKVFRSPPTTVRSSRTTKPLPPP